LVGSVPYGEDASTCSGLSCADSPERAVRSAEYPALTEEYKIQLRVTVSTRESYLTLGIDID
jgi:hypothetical protein